MIGSGTRFLSGISVYTIRLANAIAAVRPVTVITMRQLLPTRFYPGRDRVGQRLAELKLDPTVKVLDGVDWYWLPSMLRAIAFLVRNRPEIMIMQWWTGTVLHSYVLLALVGRLLGARIVIEFHEILDTGEARMGFVRAYVRLLGPLLLRMASAYAVHSTFDRDLVTSRYKVGSRPVHVLPHGPHDHYQGEVDADALPAARPASAEACNLLFFGVIRPYKGLEDLVAAFDRIPEDEIDGFWLTVVGETWEGWTLPAEMIQSSRYRDRITFVNRYVHDRELDAYLRGADAVILPYRRSSLSGPLHVAMGYGLPIVITNVGGNAEAANGYDGVVLANPADPDALNEAIGAVALLRGGQFAHPTSWDRTREAYEAVFADLERPGPKRRAGR